MEFYFINILSLQGVFARGEGRPGLSLFSLGLSLFPAGMQTWPLSLTFDPICHVDSCLPHPRGWSCAVHRNQGVTLDGGHIYNHCIPAAIVLGLAISLFTNFPSAKISLTLRPILILQELILASCADLLHAGLWTLPELPWLSQQGKHAAPSALATLSLFLSFQGLWLTGCQFGVQWKHGSCKG